MLTHFADDSTLTCSFSNMSIDSITNFSNQSLETINCWLSVNKNKVNTHKFSLILNSYREKLLLHPIQLGKETIPETEKTNF